MKIIRIFILNVSKGYTHVDGFLIVPLLLLMLVITSKSENKNSALSFLVPWFDAIVTRSWRMNALRHRTDSCHFQMNLFCFHSNFHRVTRIGIGNRYGVHA